MRKMKNHIENNNIKGLVYVYIYNINSEYILYNNDELLIEI